MATEEEKLTKRIEFLRRKNELLVQRHKEVQADMISAEQSGQSMPHGSSRYGSPRQKSNVGNKQGSPHFRAHMDDAEETTDQQTHYRSRKSQQRGWGQSNMNPVPVTSKRDRGERHNQGYDAKRLENFRMMEAEMAQTDDDKLKDEVEMSPGISRLLDDPRRKGDLDPDNRWKSTRHKGNYGGLHFENVKTGNQWGGRTHRGRGRGRAMSKLQVTAEYTGRERQDQERWQVMREAADREIMARSRNAEGGWRREWDAEKGGGDGPHQHNRHPKQYMEPRPRGRGRHGFSQGSRRSGGSSARDNSTKHNIDLHGPEDKVEIDTDKIVRQEDPSAVSDSKPQRVRKKQVKNQGHLLPQRARTPSSKDGTEVWAQNSHHSDEARGDWKNGANQSGDQWLPSLEGNSNPAIDERLLEQQEDGATVYSRQLGRGWGSEKNIKATKAWVIDTEEAGATQCDGNDMKVAEKNVEHVLKEDDKYSTSHTASPRLKKKSMGLTVEIDTTGRRVRAQPDVHPTAEKQDTVVEDTQHSGALEVQSPDFLKTPEDMKHVTDWAAEMDMQSPTYEARQLELLANLTSNEPDSTPSKHHDDDHLPPSEELSNPMSNESNFTPDLLKQIDSVVASTGKPAAEITQMQQLTTTNSENYDSHRNYPRSTDVGRTTETTPAEEVHEQLPDKYGCEELAKAQNANNVLAHGTAVDAPGDSDPQHQQADSSEELVLLRPDGESHCNNTTDQAARDTGEVSSNLLEPEQVPQHVLHVASEIPTSEQLAETLDTSIERLDVKSKNVDTEKGDTDGPEIELAETEYEASLVQGAGTVEACGVEEHITEPDHSDIAGEEVVTGAVVHENFKIEPTDTTSPQEMGNEVEDEFFECDEDRKTDEGTDER